ncbi:periplasmic nitrate reductase chaperone NapD [Selenomonas sp. GACV-9]|uniref:chaperone NapD n=1 Tax=Selenomonas sp. GACV-9 TaxID=3158782 RepID=UPI0008E04E70|nr:periplasmic nitrate reductase chaperone NapD [Selenomonas ruminantium]
MAIASLIIQLEPGKDEHVKSALKDFPQVSVEKTAPNGELILVAEESGLTKLQKLCLDLEKIPGILGVLPSYVTTADEDSDDENTISDR